MDRDRPDDPEAARAEAMRRFAGGVAHELNNLLAAIVGNASLLQASLPAGDPNRERAEGIASASARATDLARMLLLYAGRAHAASREVDVVMTLQGLVGAFGARSARVRVQAPEGRWTVRGDPAQVGLAVRLLVQRGLDATPEGEVEVRLDVERHPEAGPAEGFGQAPLAAGEYVRVEVRHRPGPDDAAALPHAFEPYVHPGPGVRGVGVAPVYGVARLNGGAVRAAAEPGWSRFDLVLPGSGGVEPQRRPRFLLVDDESTVRDFFCAAMEYLGCEADAYAEAAPALERLRADPSRYVAVVVDVGPGDLDGAALARELEARGPRLPVVACSATGETEARAALGLIPATFHLQKPFPVSALKELADRFRQG